MPVDGEQPLLPDTQYDEDASSIHTDPDFGSDSEIERLPEPADRLILEEPDQQERLLSRPRRFDGVRNAFRGPGNVATTLRRSERRGRQLKQQAEGSGNAGLIYEMEGGYKDTSSRSSSDSLDLKQSSWKENSKRGLCTRWLLISTIILVLFLALVLGAFKASHNHNTRWMFTNGTHTFGPTTILISLDGFRADFLLRDLTPAMNALIASGTSPKYMLPSFPSLTFPNHYTLVTGLYPESHGIVSNQFWDPRLQEEFYYTNTTNSMQSKWWANAEPLWNTAEKQGLKTAVHMWPGSEAHISDMDPTYLDKFNESEALDVKVNRIIQWLDMPQDRRPQFIGAYVPNVDADGHKYGPNSTEIRETIVEVDNMLTMLIEGLYNRNLTEIVNLVIVSDHGMATTSVDRLIQLDDIVDVSLVDHIDGWPLRGLRLKNPDRDVPIMHRQLLKASRDGTFDVYTRETMPGRYHFSNNDRIAPLWVVPKAGWAVVEKEDFDVAEAKASGKTYNPLGLHGYDHEHPLMRAIFIARGPAFPHLPNSRLSAFQNIEVYNIVCDSLGIEPHPNNGTFRLPLKTEGLHSDLDNSDQPPADPPADISMDLPDENLVEATSVPILSASSTSARESSSTSTAEQNRVAVDTSNTKWWDYIHNQIQKAKDWAKQLVDSFKNNKPDSSDNPV